MKPKKVAVKLTRMDWVILRRRLDNVHDAMVAGEAVKSLELKNLLDAIDEILMEETK